jgi:hypothetical protein
MNLTDCSPRNCVVTGGAGFIGSHLADALLHEGHTVVAVDNLSTGRRSNIEHLLDHPRFRFVHADINDRIVIDRLSSEASLIVHLAAAVGVKLIVEHPCARLKPTSWALRRCCGRGFGTDAELLSRARRRFMVRGSASHSERMTMSSSAVPPVTDGRTPRVR